MEKGIVKPGLQCLLGGQPLSPSRWLSHSLRVRGPMRKLHDGHRSQASSTTTVSQTTPAEHPLAAAVAAAPTSLPPPLSLLPFSTLLRSYLITSLSASPLLLRPSMRVLSALANSSSPLLNPDRNPVLHWLLKKTFYKQYCAGETSVEVRRTVEGLKGLGYKGLILGYAREVVMGEAEGEGKGKMEKGREELEEWRRGTVETARLTERGDYVAVKFTGAGSQALHELRNQLPPSKELEDAVVEVCELAKQRDVGLLFDAEQHAVQPGIDAWTLEFQKRYNRVPGQALVYGTYQAYLRSTPAVLANHLAAAADGGFTLGVKLVRGAYLGSDPRHLFWSRKEETDFAYNGIAESLMRREWSDILSPPSGERRKFPEVNLVVASHNLDSVTKAMSVRKQQLQSGKKGIPMVYGQLMGMADHVSCELIQAGNLEKSLRQSGTERIDPPRAYKYLVWGTVGECVKYLLRRAEENRDAVVRTEEGRLALRAELGRRLFGFRT